MSADCVICGRADDNLSSLGRCWPCIKASSDAHTARRAARADDPTGPTSFYALFEERRGYFDAVRRPRNGSDLVTSERPAGSPSGRVAGMCRTMAGASKGERNATLYWCACRIAEMAATGELDDTAPALLALVNVAAQAGLDGREIAATIRSAVGTSGVVA